MLAEANVSDHQKYASYLEFDFLGAAPTANSKESNSYTPRLRQFYLTGDDNPDGWHFLAGQSWSLVTMFKEGLIPRKENVPWTIDAQYVPGFDWLRNAEIRIVKDWDKKVWLGIEAFVRMRYSAAPTKGSGVIALATRRGHNPLPVSPATRNGTTQLNNGAPQAAHWTSCPTSPRSRPETHTRALGTLRTLRVGARLPRSRHSTKSAASKYFAEQLKPSRLLGWWRSHHTAVGR